MPEYRCRREQQPDITILDGQLLPSVDSENLTFLYGLTREGIKLDLSVTSEFARLLGEPQNEFRSVHVAGTNGKGSTSAYVYNILRRKYHTGLYTSPHLVSFNERIVFDRELIPDAYLEEFVETYRKIILELGESKRNPTFFEVTTLLAFKYFAERKAQYASVEVGLGGRLDSTNIITPEVSVITQIGFEHADKLGCSLTSIAMEKGGIIKPGKPIILGDGKPEVVSTIRRISQVRGSPLIISEKEATISDIESDISGSRFVLGTRKNEYKISTSLAGKFQVKNVTNAILAVEQMDDLRITRGQIEKAIAATRWPGRMEIIRSDPILMVDCAHNPPAANALAQAFFEFHLPEPVLVIGMLSDKDTYSFLHAARKISSRVIFTIPDEPERAVPPEKLAEIGRTIFTEVKIIHDPVEAYRSAMESSPITLVLGSMYLVGVVMAKEKVPVMPFHDD